MAKLSHFNKSLKKGSFRLRNDAFVQLLGGHAVTDVVYFALHESELMAHVLELADDALDIYDYFRGFVSHNTIWLGNKLFAAAATALVVGY